MPWDPEVEGVTWVWNENDVEEKKQLPKIRKLIHTRFGTDPDFYLQQMPKVTFADQGCWVNVNIWIPEEDYKAKGDADV